MRVGELVGLDDARIDDANNTVVRVRGAKALAMMVAACEALIRIA